MKTGKGLNKPVTTSPMRRISPPTGDKTVSVPVSKVDNSDAMLEALRTRINELEERLARLEGAVDVNGQDVVINAAGSVLIQGLGAVELSAGSLRCGASTVEFNTAVTKATGIVECGTLLAGTVTAAIYTPGVGNVW